MVGQRHRGVADTGREQFDHHRRQRAVGHGRDQDHGHDQQHHHRLVDAGRVCFGRVAGLVDGSAHGGFVKAADLLLANTHHHLGASGRFSRAVGQALFDQEGLDLVAGAVKTRLAHRVELEGAALRVGHHHDWRLTAGGVDLRVGVVAQGLEQREIQHRGQQQAEHQDRLAPDPVRQPTEKHEERRADHHADDQQGVGLGRVHLQHLGHEEQHVELRGVEGHGLPGVDAEQGGEHHFQVRPGGERLPDRRLADLALGLHFHEGRRFVHAHADPGGDCQQHDRQQERQAPAPGFELVATDIAATQHHQQR
ncbi:hypothetical protein D9M71_197370 [compost metagenome]